MGNKADKAEDLSIKFFCKILKEIKEIYEPGGMIKICSDGSAHNRVRDNTYLEDDRLRYLQDLQSIIDVNKAHDLIVIRGESNLQNTLDDGGFVKLREELSSLVSEKIR